MIKKDIRPTNNKKQKHGLWIHYKTDGNLWSKGYYINNLEHGYWIYNWNPKQNHFFLK